MDENYIILKKAEFYIIKNINQYSFKIHNVQSKATSSGDKCWKIFTINNA